MAKLPDGYVYGEHGRVHPDRARQFMPFAALRGYYDLIAQRTMEVEKEVLDREFAGEYVEDSAHIEEDRERSGDCCNEQTWKTMS